MSPPHTAKLASKLLLNPVQLIAVAPVLPTHAALTLSLSQLLEMLLLMQPPLIAYQFNLQLELQPRMLSATPLQYNTLALAPS